MAIENRPAEGKSSLAAVDLQAGDLEANAEGPGPSYEQFCEIEPYFRVLAEMVPDILATTRPDGSTDFCNERFYRCTGLPRGSGLALDWKPLIHPADLERVLMQWSTVVESGRAAEFRYRLRMADGSYRWFMGRNTPLVNSAGQIRKWVICCTDIHDLKQTQEALEQSERRLRYILNSAPLILWAVDEQGVVTLSEGKALASLGLQPGETVGRSVFDMYRDTPDVLGVVRRALSGETLTNILTELGDTILESHLYPLSDPGGELIGSTGVTLDITQLKRSEQSLRKAHDELEIRVHDRTAELNQTVEKLRSEQGALRRLLRLHDRERQLLAYDIHDGLAQKVISAKMIVEGNRARLGADQTDCQQQLDVAEDLLGQAVLECRRMIGNLRPLVIDECGIVEAIRDFVGQEHLRGGLEIKFHHDVQFTRLAPLLEGSLFRIVQEAISNVRRHSGEKEAEIRLVQSGEQLTLEIRDEGTGFDPAAAPDDRFGLEGIRKRAELFEGQATVDSVPGRGTRVAVTLPVLRASEDDECDRT